MSRPWIAPCARARHSTPASAEFGSREIVAVGNRRAPPPAGLGLDDVDLAILTEPAREPDLGADARKAVAGDRAGQRTATAAKLDPHHARASGDIEQMARGLARRRCGHGVALVRRRLDEEQPPIVVPPVRVHGRRRIEQPTGHQRDERAAHRPPLCVDDLAGDLAALDDRRGRRRHPGRDPERDNFTGPGHPRRRTGAARREHDTPHRAA